jgi:hypothetical protein
MNRFLTAALVGMTISVLAGCDVPNPVKWVGGKITEPASPEEKAAIEKKKPLPVEYAKIGGTCATNDPALVLCKNYDSKSALLADPNVKKFGFKITVDEKEIHDGLSPAIKYRTLKDGSLERG